MRFILLIIGALLFGCCNSNKQVATTVTSHGNYTKQENKTSTGNPIDISASPIVIIYKTKSDFNDKVPVILNDDKTKIVSYPSPKDIYFNDKLSLPDKLYGGFLLDNRGINKNVAFLKISYEEYSKLTESPLVSEMMKMIVDTTPLIEMYNCGNRYQYKDIINDLNKIIDEKQLSKFKKIY